MGNNSKNGSHKGGYEVGYGRPPVHSRWRKGQSGNAKGKPKGAKSLLLQIGDAMRARVPVTENGKRKQVSKGEAAAIQVVNRAAAGDLKSLNTLIMVCRLLQGESIAGLPSGGTSDNETLVMETILRRIRSQAAAPTDRTNEPTSKTSSPISNRKGQKK